MKKFSLTSINVKHSKLSAIILCAIVVAIIVYLFTVFSQMWTDDTFYPGEGVTETHMLSEWNSKLEGTVGDTEVYFLEGEEPGATMLVLGGTHANEPSGVLSATYLLENAKPKAGTLIVITETNKAGFTCTDPQEGVPMFYTISTPTGDRTFRYGSRVTNPIYQWPDPDIYVHASSGQRLSGSETRNINRTYPGRTNGTFTEQISYAVTSMIKDLDVDITVDLHEASPEYPTINAIVSHEDAMDMASYALLNLQLDGVDISLEPSAPNLHGLTHRELGDNTDTRAVLMETSNPAQGRLHGATSSELITEGKDKYYEKAAATGHLYVPFTEEGHPLPQRVARHVTGIIEFANAYNELALGDPIDLGELASYDDLCENLYTYLAIPEDAAKE